MKQTVLNYSAMFRKEPERGYTVKIASLPGCVTYGKTIEEGEKMAADAIQIYIASLKKHDEPVPK